MALGEENPPLIGAVYPQKPVIWNAVLCNEVNKTEPVRS